LNHTNGLSAFATSPVDVVAAASPLSVVSFVPELESVDPDPEPQAASERAIIAAIIAEITFFFIFVPPFLNSACLMHVVILCINYNGDGLFII
jgi:hypothetical protein